MKFELVNLTEQELTLYNLDNIEANGTNLIYHSLSIIDNMEDFWAEYKINTFDILINEGKLGIKWNDYLLNDEYSSSRLNYEMDFYSLNRITDKYVKADWLRKKRQLVISYLEYTGSEYQLVRDLLDRYQHEIEMYILGGTTDLRDVVNNESDPTFLDYLNTVVGVIPYTQQLETVKDSILRNIK